MERLVGDASPPIHRRLAEVVWEHDPLGVIHGCWFAGVWDGRARLTRALTSRIDALGVQSQSAQIGGQKSRDALDEPGGVEDMGFKTVRGEAPYYTAEVSASRIVSPIVLDLALLRSYGLRQDTCQALVATGILQIAELIAAWPRRRSRCILDVRDVTVRRPAGLVFPSLNELHDGFLAELRTECFNRCRAATAVENAEPLVLRYVANAKKAKKPSEGEGS